MLLLTLASSRTINEKSFFKLLDIFESDLTLVLNGRSIFIKKFCFVLLKVLWRILEFVLRPFKCAVYTLGNLINKCYS